MSQTFSRTNCTERIHDYSSWNTVKQVSVSLSFKRILASVSKCSPQMKGQTWGLPQSKNLRGFSLCCSLHANQPLRDESLKAALRVPRRHENTVKHTR